MAKIVMNDGRELVIEPFDATACGVDFTFDADAYHVESIMELIAYGVGRRYQDRGNAWAWACKNKGEKQANGTVRKYEPTDADKAAFIGKLIESHKAAPFGDSRGGGTRIGNVESVAFGFACADIMSALGIKKKDGLIGNKKAVDSETGEPFLRATKEGKPVYVAEAMRAFIARNPEGDYMGRAARYLAEKVAKPKVTVKL